MLQSLLKNLTAVVFIFLTTECASQIPIINSFTPDTGVVGTLVTIKGLNFAKSPLKNIVYFGAAKANVLKSTDTLLSVSAPTGATFQPLSVTVKGFTAYSTKPFIETFAGEKLKINENAFLNKKDYTTVGYAHWTGLADFDVDGKVDVLVSQGSTSYVSIFPNSSADSLSFNFRRDFPLSTDNHEGGAIADLDGDGKMDFVITNTDNTSSISIFRNLSLPGFISFAQRQDYAVDSAPYNVASGDIDGDGKPDLVVANNGSNVISIFKNTSTIGNISFAPRFDYTVGTYPFGVAIGDLDGDDKPDIAVTTQGSSSSLFVIRNISVKDTIKLQEPEKISGGVFSVAIGDLNGDKKPELVLANISQLTLLPNTSVPGTISFDYPKSFIAGDYIVSAEIADIDGDGKLDIVTADRMTNYASVFQNTTKFDDFSFVRQRFVVGEGPKFTSSGDLDGDGKPEISVANSSSSSISILKNLIGSNVAPTINSFTPQKGYNGTTISIKGTNFNNVSSVKFGDTDAGSFTIDSSTGITAIVGDGATGDVSVTSYYGRATLPGFVFIGATIESFKPATGITGTVVRIVGKNFYNVTAVKFGNTNAASFTVISSSVISAVVGQGSSGNVTVITANNGEGSKEGFTYSLPVIESFSPVIASSGSTIVINGSNFSIIPEDNILRFGTVRATVVSATANQLTAIVPVGAAYAPLGLTINHLTCYSSLPFHSIFPDNGGIDDSSFIPVITLSTGQYPFSLTTADLNDDGKNDIITINGADQTISVFENTSTMNNISFNNEIRLFVGLDIRHVATGDIDGDGKLDIIMTNMNHGLEGSISLYLNKSFNGKIILSERQDFKTGNGPISIATSDMNGDGKTDIVVSSSNSGFFSVFINTTTQTGVINFTREDFTGFERTDKIIIFDLNQDGKPDLITANYATFSDGISIFTNISKDGRLLFNDPETYATSFRVNNIVSGDFDEDGKPDILGSSDNEIFWFKNLSYPGYTYLSLRILQILPDVRNISVGDINGDGKIDFCASQYNTGKIYVYENISMPFEFLNFDEPVIYQPGIYDTYVSNADIDGDGKPEILSSNTTQNNVVIYKNQVHGVVLPKNLISFSGLQNDKIITLQWKIENEQNLDHYEITKSKNGLSFLSIGTIKAENHGAYKYYDSIKDFNQSRLFYRLKQISKDGRIEYSSIVTIILPNSHVIAYPNPVKNILQIEGLPANLNKYEYDIISVYGKLLMKGSNYSGAPIDVRSLAKGTYFLKIYMHDFKTAYTIKIVKE